MSNTGGLSIPRLLRMRDEALIAQLEDSIGSNPTHHRLGGNVSVDPSGGAVNRPVPRETRWRIRVGARGGVVYRFPGQGIVSQNRYDIEGFFRATAEASLRRRFVAGTELGVRLFGGAWTSCASRARTRAEWSCSRAWR